MGINLLNYVLAKNYTNSAVKEAIKSVYRYCGSVETFEDLPTQGLTVGDVYDVRVDGTNYAWNGESWDSLGVNQVATFTRNGLAKLATTSDLNPDSDIDYSKLTALGRDYFYKPTSAANVINIQQPGFAEKEGVYVTVASGIGRVSVNGSENEGLCAIDGAGVIVYLSSLVKEKNIIVITHAMGESEVELYNQNGEPEGDRPQETDAKIVNPYHLINYQTAWWARTKNNPTLLGATITDNPLLVTSGLTINGVADSSIGGNNLAIYGTGRLTIEKETVISGEKDFKIATVGNIVVGVNLNGVSNSILMDKTVTIQDEVRNSIIIGVSNTITAAQSGNTAESLVIGNYNSFGTTNYILGQHNTLSTSIRSQEASNNLVVGELHELGSAARYNYVFGKDNEISNSVGQGYNSYNLIVGLNNQLADTSLVEHSALIGKNLISNHSNQFITGVYNVNKEDTLLEVGNGTQEHRKNVFEVTKDSTIKASNLGYEAEVVTNRPIQLQLDSSYSPIKYQVSGNQVEAEYDNSTIPEGVVDYLYYTWYDANNHSQLSYYCPLNRNDNGKVTIPKLNDNFVQIGLRVESNSHVNTFNVSGLKDGDETIYKNYNRPIKDIINYEYDVKNLTSDKIITGANMSYGQPKTYNLYNLTNGLDAFDLTFVCTKKLSSGGPNSRVYIAQGNSSNDALNKTTYIYDETKAYVEGNSFTIQMKDVKDNPWIAFRVSSGAEPTFDGYCTPIRKKSLINNNKIIPLDSFNSEVKEKGAYYLVKSQTTDFFGEVDYSSDYSVDDIVYTVNPMPTKIDFTTLTGKTNLINKYSIPSTNAFASSTAIPGGYLPQECFDLNTGSQWRTQMPCANEEYIGIDLVQPRTFSYIAVAWDYYFYPPTFYVQSSEDGQNWTTVQTLHQSEVLSNQAAVYKLDAPLTTRWFRLLLPNTDGRDSGYAAFEIGLFEGNLTYWQFNENFYGEGTTVDLSQYASQYYPSASFDYTIAEVSYQVVDRHQNVLLDSGLQIPAPTAADEGKILQVVNGKLAYVDKATINGETIKL